jgi:hypothetical protein
VVGCCERWGKESGDKGLAVSGVLNDAAQEALADVPVYEL